ncbi:MAG TPA: metallophosphoesterase [Bacteroidales bacterium]|nr:metallophosphoesterase [Bacteroidales bacterium]
MIKFIHTADIHADGNPESYRKLESSLKEMLEFVKDRNIDFILISGDVWDKQQTFNGKSGVTLIIEYLTKLSELVKNIFIVKGNNHHDNEGSISLLHQLRKNIYAYEKPAMLAVDSLNSVYDLLNGENPPEDPQHIVTLIPYPTKAGLIDKLPQTNIDVTNVDVADIISELFRAIGFIREQYEHTPHILSFHGTITGSKLSNGQPAIGQELKFSSEQLELAKANYYALGHIHLRQEIIPNMLYSGSLYNCNWGETEKKSFELVTIENGVTIHEPVYLNAKPMVKLDGGIKNGEIFFSNLESEIQEAVNSQVRINLNIGEDERKAINVHELKERLIKQFGEDITLNINTIPKIRETRSEEIINAKSMEEEVKAFAKSIGFEITEEHLKELFAIEEAVKTK